MSSPSSPAAMEASDPPTKVMLPQLKASLEKVISARGNVYAEKTAVIFYWEDDDTGAEKDAESLKAVLVDCFGITPEIHSLKNKTPAWDAGCVIFDLLRKFHPPTFTSTGDLIMTFFMFAYIGHGKRDSNGELALVSSTGKTLPWSTIRSQLFSDKGLTHVDVFGFLDCCYSGAARDQLQRTLQILAASGEKEYTRSRTAGVSFTQRFASAVASLRNRSDPLMTTASLFADIMAQKPPDADTPHFSSLGGIHPIALPFEKAGTTPGSPSQQPGQSHSTDTMEKHVLVKLTVNGQAGEVLNEVHDAARGLPASWKVSIVEAFETGCSALLLLRMTWEAWARIDAAVPLEIVGTVIGSSLLHERKGLSLFA